MAVRKHSNLVVNCNGDDNDTPECPECNLTEPGITILCCPTPNNSGCILTCETPVLIKACGGVPPYSFYGDDEFLQVTAVSEDTAIVSIRLRFVQFGYQLRFERTNNDFNGPASNCAPHSDHPTGTTSFISVKQRNLSYDCDMVLLPFDGGWGDLFADAFPFNDVGCFDIVDEPGQLGMAVPLTGSGAGLYGVIRTDVTGLNFRIYSANPAGLDMIAPIDPTNCPAFGAPPTLVNVETGVFALIPAPPVDVYAYDALNAFAIRNFVF